MPISFNQNPVSASQATVASLGAALPNAVISGDDLIAIATSPGTVTFTCADNINGSWGAPVVTQSGGSGTNYIFYLANSLSAGAGAMTVTITPSVSASCRLTVFDCQGVGIFDQGAIHSGITTTPTAGPTATLAQNGGEFIVCGATSTAGVTTWAAGTGYTLVNNGASTTWGSEYAFTTSNAGVSASFTIGASQNVGIAVAVFTASTVSADTLLGQGWV